MTEKNTSKQMGATYEAIFIAEAMKRGFNVLEPRGDFLSYDVVLENPHKVLHKVQIKGTTCLQKGKHLTYKVLAASGNSRYKKNIVTKDTADFLAAYVVPAKTWYHIPAENITSISVSLRPDVPSSKGQYEIWKEAWNVYYKKEK